MNPENERLLLRRAMRERRSKLQTGEITTADEQLAINIVQLLDSKQLTQNDIRIAGYLATDGEIPLQKSFEKLRNRGLKTYVPVIRNGILKFALLTPVTSLHAGKYGIAVPVCDEADLLEPETIDIVLTPLLAFDATGNRLGMGGGYYDRTFAYQHPDSNDAADADTRISEQLFIGVAHAFQKVDHVPIESWDVPLQYAVTDQDIYEFKSV